MVGTVRGTGQPIKIQYEQGMSSDSLSTNIDGEAFAGRAVLADSRAGFGTAYSVGEFGSGVIPVYTTSSSGTAMATLLGSRGSSLQCQLQYADPTGETTSGGVGICKHSDGRLIDVLW
jgi:hypothetical protein